MNKKIAVIALASLTALPMLASAAANHPITFPPGPNFWAFVAFFFGG